MSKEKEYYNYVAFYRGIPVYVGKGKGDRWFHTVSGQSKSELINDFYFRSKYLKDMPLDTYKVAYFTTDKQASRNERKLIGEYLPYCNKCAGRDWTSEYSFSYKLYIVSKNLGFSAPEQLQSKFDFRFLFTPKGLLCRTIELSETSPFERAEEDYHIRVKKKLFIHFPEYALQFANFVPEMVNLNMLDMGGSKRKVINDVERCRDVFSHVTDDMDWILGALNGGSLDFAENFGFNKNGFNHVNHCYFKTNQSSHVEAYKKHQYEVLKQERKVNHEKKKKQDTVGSVLNLLKGKGKIVDEEYINKNNPNRLLTMLTSNGVRVRNKSENLEYLRSFGFDMKFVSTWINIHKQDIPNTTIFINSKYVPLKGLDDLKLLDLSEFNLKEKT